MRTLFLLTALILSNALTAAAQAADIGVGRVLAFDRDAQRLVLTDRSSWSLASVSSRIPEELSAGDRVQFSYEAEDSGPGEIIEINVTRESDAEAVRISESGTVFAIDRAAKVLVLEDKSAWFLATMRNALPVGISAGDRVRIEFEPGEGGSRRVHEIRIIAQ